MKAICTVRDLPPGENVVVQVEGVEIAVFNVEGTFYAVSNVCPHMDGPVGTGPLEETEGRLVLTCPFHRWRFDLETGEALFPGDKRLPTYDIEFELETFDTDVADGTLYVDI